MNPTDELQIANFINELASSLQASTSQSSFNPPPIDAVRAPPPANYAESRSYDSLDSFWIFNLYTTDFWTLLLFFSMCLCIKLAYRFGLSKSAVKRTQAALSEKHGHSVNIEVAQIKLEKPLSYVLSWMVTILTEGACLILQCCAWRIWAISDEPPRQEDLQYMMELIKVLLIGYVVDLLMNEKSFDIYIHHCLTFVLLFIGQCTIFSTGDPNFPRLANWLILQATLAFPLYFGLGLVAVERFLHVQNHKIDLQKRALKYAYYFMRFMTWIYIPSKIVPAAFSLYFLAKMWNDMKQSAWGIVWLSAATITIPLLILLQIFVLSDGVASSTAYIGYRVYGGPLPSRRGPIARFVSRNFPRRRGLPRNSSKGKISDRKEEEDDRATNASAKSLTPLFFVDLAKEAGRKGSVASSLTAGSDE